MCQEVLLNGSIGELGVSEQPLRWIRADIDDASLLGQVMLFRPRRLLDFSLLVLLCEVIRPWPGVEVAGLEWVLHLLREFSRRANGLCAAHCALKLLNSVEWTLGRLPRRASWQRHRLSLALFGIPGHQRGRSRVRQFKHIRCGENLLLPISVAAFTWRILYRSGHHRVLHAFDETAGASRLLVCRL